MHAAPPRKQTRRQMRPNRFPVLLPQFAVVATLYLHGRRTNNELSIVRIVPFERERGRYISSRRPIT